MRVRTRIFTAVGAGAAITALSAGPALASTHTVRAGDSLSNIAARYRVSLAKVEAANPQIPNPDFITVGELVKVPDGKPGRGTAPAGPAPVTSAAPSSASQASTSTGTSTTATGGGSAPSSFQQCVAWRESSNTPTDPDGLYGILPSTWQSLGYSGTAGQASVATQNEAFQRLYAKYGTSPWAPYDGC
jgi:LysM repeat protein